jgi:hypothetical protein
MNIKTKTPSPLAVARAMTTLLEGAYWPSTLEPHSAYVRRHDDTDGKRGPDQDLTVTIGPDGDAWLTAGLSGDALRFRTLGGGGQSTRVRNALLVLAEAIRRDNAEHPQ